MASITQIKVTGSWRAQVRRKGFAPQCATFETKEQAVQWARALEHKIDRREDPGANRQVLVAEVLRVYTQEREGAAALSDSQRGRANNLLKVLGKERAVSLNLGDLESFCRYRIDVDGVQPQSVVMDLNTLSVALRFYGAKRGTRLPVVVDKAAREHLRSLRLIADSPARSRRADARELKAILKHLPKEYHDVLLFAVASAMRRGEIASLKWSDVVESDRCVWVRARKHPDPAIKEHNDGLVPLLGAAWTILKRQKRRAGSDLIFHFNKKDYSAAITAACKASGVENFRGHDLRHEGISRAPEALHAPEAEGPAQAQHAVAQDGGRVGEGNADAKATARPGTARAALRLRTRRADDGSRWRLPFTNRSARPCIASAPRGCNKLIDLLCEVGSSPDDLKRKAPPPRRRIREVAGLNPRVRCRPRERGRRKLQFTLSRFVVAL